MEHERVERRVEQNEITEQKIRLPLFEQIDSVLPRPNWYFVIGQVVLKIYSEFLDKPTSFRKAYLMALNWPVKITPAEWDNFLIKLADCGKTKDSRCVWDRDFKNCKIVGV